MSVIKKRQKVIKSHPRLSLKDQCILLNLHRSGVYYKPRGESALNLRLMTLIDKYFLKHPYYGIARMTDYLRYDMGYRVNQKRIRRLYRLMNLKTFYAKPKTTIRDKNSHKYPYLLKAMKINRINQVWQTDITYIPMHRGFMYMAAIIDVYSRKVLSWDISNTMTAEWCKEVLLDAISDHGKPEIHNSDQGSQYTSDEYISTLKEHGIQISMDGKGRALDNVYIERFWRSLKYEKIYLHPANGGIDLRKNVKEYIQFYNQERRHTEIGKVPPDERYFNGRIAC